MDIVKEFYEAERVYTTLPADTPESEQRKAREAWLAPLADDEFVLTQSPDLPWGGEYHGECMPLPHSSSY